MVRAPQRLVLLGSTGSLGQQTLEVVRALADRFQVLGLHTRTVKPLFLDQIAEFRPAYVAVSEPAGLEALCELQRRVPFTIVGPEELATVPEAQLVLIATVGRAGLFPTLAALQAGKTVLLANKEVLAMAGHLVQREARRNGGTLRPVDSEHVALWQCLQGEDGHVARLILTASGGALRDRPLASLADVTPAEALLHPTWRMGPKITIDSATLFNKALEVIEAHWLFDVPLERIDVVLHRESIVHSLVEFVDGSVKAQLGLPDMRHALQYALAYPERCAHTWVQPLDLARLGQLTFGPVDLARYPCFALACEAWRRGGTAAAVLCAVDEVAVEAFLAGRLRFLDIPRLLEAALAWHHPITDPSLDDLLCADDEARRWAQEQIAARTP